MPKKDLCLFCETYRVLEEKEKKKKENEYNLHVERKEDVRIQKQQDKEKAKTDKTIKVINFDLQKVLISPKTEVGNAYYSRKLSTYNFTVFDVDSTKAICYMWYESIAQRGSNEIASCLYKYLEQLGHVKECIFYSDSCTGQQRNLPFSTMCLYAVETLEIDQITHNYFERGHSQMEGDSVHARIEKATKRQDILIPFEWMMAVRNAKVNEPKYSVCEIKTEDIKDFKLMSTATVGNRSKAVDGSKLEWRKVHSFQYRKSEPNRIYFKNDFRSEFNHIEICRANLRRKVNLSSIKDFELQRAYTDKIPISEKKYKNLINLCKQNIIPPRLHKFYQELPHGKTVDSDDSDNDECN